MTSFPTKPVHLSHCLYFQNTSRVLTFLSPFVFHYLVQTNIILAWIVQETLFWSPFFFHSCSLSFVVIIIPRLSCLKSEWNRVLSQHRDLQKLPSQVGVILWTHWSVTLVKIVTTCTWRINPFHLMFFLLPSSLACPWHTHNSFVILGSLKRTRLCFVQSLLYLCPYSTSFFL